MLKKEIEHIATMVYITPYEYGQQIAKTIISWFLDEDTNTEGVEFDNEQEIIETAETIIQYIKDYYGIKEGGEE